MVTNINAYDVNGNAQNTNSMQKILSVYGDSGVNQNHQAIKDYLLSKGYNDQNTDTWDVPNIIQGLKQNVAGYVAPDNSFNIVQNGTPAPTSNAITGNQIQTLAAQGNSGALQQLGVPQTQTATQQAPTTPYTPTTQDMTTFNGQFNPLNKPISELYMTPKYATEEAARRAGYTGPFSGGGANIWLSKASPEQKIKYYDELRSLGATLDSSGNIIDNKVLTPEQITSNSAKDVLTYMQDSVQKPELPTGTSLTPELQSVQPNELVSQAPLPAGQQTSAPVVNAPAAIPQTSANATQVNAAPIMGMLDPTTGQWVPITGNNAAQGTAEQGQVSALSTVKGQLEGLYSDMQNGQVPAWAKGAVTKAESILADRGLGTSTIGAAAIAAAIQESAINIAAPDAATYFQMDMTNLSNRQQMALENLKNRQQGLISDQSINNAAAQFNATNKQQADQFAASLVASIQEQNASRATSISQFNASEANKIATQIASNTIAVDTFNSQQQKAVNDFNSTLAFNRDTFNANMQYAIDQSNALWRRTINTANTAAINAANETNVQNQFNLSSVALNNLWQAFRDEAAWAFSASESAQDRAFNASMAANNRQFAEDQSGFNWAVPAGQFAFNLLGNALANVTI